MKLYFSFAEPGIGCKCGAPYPHEWRATRGRELLETASIVREAYGAPLVSLSGYRCPACNRKAREKSIARLIQAGRTREQAERETGVAKDSQHMEGRALDMRHAGAKPSRWRPEDSDRVRNLWMLAGELHAAGKLPYLGGIGRYGRWTHLDCRVNRRGKPARWAHGIV